MKFSIALRESAQLALQSLLQHKLRSLLSVLGISIGIFAIVFVFTLVDSLEMDIKKSVQSLGKKVIYIDKFEWMGGKGGEYPWWKYISRPNATFNEMDNLNKSSISPLIDAISFTSSRNVSLKNGKYSVESVSVKGFTSEFTSIQDLEIEQGRFFNKLEDINAKPVAVIGYNIAQGLFPETQQLIGKYITLFGKKVQVIGVFKNQGDNIINMDFDDQIVVPIKFMQIVNPMPYSDANIIVKAKENIDIDKFEKELEGSFRSIRRLNPKEENNFALNKISFLTDSITQFFSTIKILGIIIGMFSLLVGGFGVANIMFVSVKERTSLIGIQKALGAPSYFILMQFLLEAILLSILGGMVGVLITWLFSVLGNFIIHNAMHSNFTIVLTYFNVFIGVFFSAIIGLLAGHIPARNASKLEPVKAIRS